MMTSPFFIPIQNYHSSGHCTCDIELNIDFGYYLQIYEVIVPDQVRTLSQVGTKKISKGGWTILELFGPRRNHYLSFRSRSD